jgi:hypothetical protein
VSDNITLPRAVALQIRELLETYENPDWWIEAEYAALTALDAALAEPEPDAIARAVEAEREACAKVCEQPSDEIQITDDISQRIYKDAFDCAEAIRARGSK